MVATAALAAPRPNRARDAAKAAMRRGVAWRGPTADDVQEVVQGRVQGPGRRAGVHHDD